MIRKKERKKERKKGSAAVDPQQTSVNADASGTAGEKVALIFHCQGCRNDGQQGAAEKRGKLARKGKRINHGMSCERGDRSLSRERTVKPANRQR
jgi:hypothetical protein